MNPDYIDIGLPEDKLIEECSEVIKAICKAKRFGINGQIPGAEIGYTNKERIIEELNDLELALFNYRKELIKE